MNPLKINNFLNINKIKVIEIKKEEDKKIERPKTALPWVNLQYDIKKLPPAINIDDLEISVREELNLERNK